MRNLLPLAAFSLAGFANTALADWSNFSGSLTAQAHMTTYVWDGLPWSNGYNRIAEDHHASGYFNSQNAWSGEIIVAPTPTPAPWAGTESWGSANVASTFTSTSLTLELNLRQSIGAGADCQVSGDLLFSPIEPSDLSVFWLMKTMQPYGSRGFTGSVSVSRFMAGGWVTALSRQVATASYPYDEAWEDILDTVRLTSGSLYRVSVAFSLPDTAGNPTPGTSFQWSMSLTPAIPGPTPLSAMLAVGLLARRRRG